MSREIDHSGTYSTVGHEAPMLDCHLDNVFLSSGIFNLEGVLQGVLASLLS